MIQSHSKCRVQDPGEKKKHDILVRRSCFRCMSPKKPAPGNSTGSEPNTHQIPTCRRTSCRISCFCWFLKLPAMWQAEVLSMVEAYYVNDTFWQKGSGAPIFLCVGGEGGRRICRPCSFWGDSNLHLLVAISKSNLLWVIRSEFEARRGSPEHRNHSQVLQGAFLITPTSSRQGLNIERFYDVVPAFEGAVWCCFTAKMD